MNFITMVKSIDWQTILSVTSETIWAFLVSTLAGTAVGGFHEYTT